MQQTWHDPATAMWILGAAGTVIAALFGVLHAVQNRRLNKVEENKVDKDVCAALCGDIKEVKECIQGKDGLKDVVARMDERVNFLYEAKRNSGG